MARKITFWGLLISFAVYGVIAIIMGFIEKPEGNVSYAPVTTGWVNYSDTNIKRTAPIVLTQDTTRTYPFLWDNATTNQLPRGLDSMYSRPDTGIMMNAGDDFLARLSFSARATIGGTVKIIRVQLFVGGTQGNVFTQDVALNKETDWAEYSCLLFGFAGTTFQANKGKIKMTALNGNVEVGGLVPVTTDVGTTLLIHKMHKGI